MDDLDLKKLDQVFRQQVHHCQEQMKAGKCQDELIIKSLRASRAAVSLLQRFTASDDDSNKKDDEDLKLALHNYTRSVLDSTYYQECTLTGLEFQGDAPFRQIAAVNKALSLPPQLCGSPDKVGEVLGTELVECVYWRVGALLYMFCHSLYEGDSERRAKMDKDMFLECCCAGVGHLRLMLSARTPLGEDDDYISHDTDMVQLLQQGIFSDIHMLSLMYAGEMCFWAWEVSSTSTQQFSPTHSGGNNQKNSKSGQRTKNGTSKVPSADNFAQLKGSKIVQVGDNASGSEETSKEVTSTKEVNGISEELEDSLCAGANKMAVTDDELSEDVSPGCGTGPDRLEKCEHSAGSEETNLPSADQTDLMSQSLSAAEENMESSSVDESSVGEVTDTGATSGGKRKPPCSKVTEGVTLYNVMLHTRGQSVVDSWKKDFDSLKHGVEMLSKYINVARGPLKKHGWNYSKAVELMVKLKKASMQRN